MGTDNKIKTRLLEIIAGILFLVLAGGAPFASWGVPYPWDLILTIAYFVLSISGLVLFLCLWLETERENRQLHWKDQLVGWGIVLCAALGFVGLIIYIV